MSYKKINSKIDFDNMRPEQQEYIKNRRKTRKRRLLISRIFKIDAALLGVLGVVLIGSVVTSSLNAKAEKPSAGAFSQTESADGGAAGLSGSSASSGTKGKTITKLTDLDDTAAFEAAANRTDYIRKSKQYKAIAEAGYPVVPDTRPESLTCLITRKFRLPGDYVPADLQAPDVKFSFGYMTDKRKLRKVAGDAMKEMFDDAASKAGIELIAVSGYRPYSRQVEIYLNNVMAKGVDGADAVSAQPGSSEHQSGLTMDLSAKSAACDLTQDFGKTREGKWLARNCSQYGFIIRYPADKEKITGYEYEPWHIRYVGPALATYLNDKGLCLDEYYGITAEDE